MPDHSRIIAAERSCQLPPERSGYLPGKIAFRATHRRRIPYTERHNPRNVALQWNIADSPLVRQYEKDA